MQPLWPLCFIKTSCIVCLPRPSEAQYEVETLSLFLRRYKYNVDIPFVSSLPVFKSQIVLIIKSCLNLLIAWTNTFKCAHKHSLLYRARVSLFCHCSSHFRSSSLSSVDSSPSQHELITSPTTQNRLFCNDSVNKGFLSQPLSWLEKTKPGKTILIFSLSNLFWWGRANNC